MCNRAPRYAKHRVRFNSVHVSQLLIAIRIASLQFANKMVQFEPELLIGNRDTLGVASTSYLAAIESIASDIRFIRNEPQVSRYSSFRVQQVPEAVQLRVVFITACFSRENFLRQQCFSPECNKAF